MTKILDALNRQSKPRKGGVEVLVSVGCSGLCCRMALQSMLAEWGWTVKGMVKEIRKWLIKKRNSKLWQIASYFSTLALTV